MKLRLNEVAVYETRQVPSHTGLYTISRRGWWLAEKGMLGGQDNYLGSNRDEAEDQYEIVFGRGRVIEWVR